MERELVRVLTPPGAAGIAVVELRGAVGRFVARHLRGQTRGSAALTLRLPARRWVMDGDGVLDDALVLLRSAEVLELHLHGGPWIVRRTVQLAEACGFSQASVLPRTAEDWLPFMRTEAGVRLLLDQPNRTEPTDVEDATLHRMAFPARVALVGPPNVGKSTLANRLLGRARFITADVPGTTRDWVEELADVNGLPLMVTDTPGRRTTGDAVEAEAIRRSADVVKRADVVVAVHDATVNAEWPAADVRVMNKSDQQVGGAGLAVSALEGTGMDALCAAICAALGVDLTPHRRRVLLPHEVSVTSRRRGG